jgi:DNA-binding response OmpR family regulator
MPDKILVVEDEITLQETLAYNLERQGYAVETAGDGLKALELAQQSRPDLIILDIMLPGMDGLEVCRILRKDMNTPIIILTARDDEIDRVVGLEVGADDYITKPFSIRELMARVKAQLRRVRMLRDEYEAVPVVNTQPSEELLIFSNLAIDLVRREVKRDGQVIALKPQEYELLLFLARHIGHALSREYILQTLWGWEFTGDSRTIDVHVRWLREKIEKDPSKPKRIITVRGSGYRFEG